MFQKDSKITGIRSKKLLILDFDYILLENNADLVIHSLLPARSLPYNHQVTHLKDDWARSSSLVFSKDDRTTLFSLGSAWDNHSRPQSQVSYAYRNWFTYMKDLYSILFERNVSKLIISNEVLQIKPINGIKTFIKHAKNDLNFDIIIISDSNTYFIDIWLKAAGLSEYIKEVFSNPAEFKDGFLDVQPYHDQTKCGISPRNLCKKKVFNDYMEQHTELDYKQTVLISYGNDNFCTILKLKKTDLACLRFGFPLLNSVNKTLKSKYVSDRIKCEIFVWNDGNDLLNYFIQKYGHKIISYGYGRV